MSYAKQQATTSTNTFTEIGNTIKKGFIKIISVNNKTSTNQQPRTIKNQSVAPQQPKQTFTKSSAPSKTCFFFICW
jgi:hypothetical protein